MRSYIKVAVAFAGLCFGGVAWAAAVVIDFNLEHGAVNAPRSEDGFIIDPALAPSVPYIDSWLGGDYAKSMIFCGFCQDGFEGVSIYQHVGLTFELDSLEVFSGYAGLQPQVFEGLVTGYLQGGGTVTQTFSTNAFGIKPILFDSSWTNLTSVDIVFDTSTSYPLFAVVPGIDNITLTYVVPVPAAVWLFASGLGVLGWRHRRIS